MFSLNKQTSKALEVTAGYALANILIKRKQQQGRWSLAAGMPVGMRLINVGCNSLSVSPSSWCQQAALSAASSRPSKADFSIFLGKSTHITQAHFVQTHVSSLCALTHLTEINVAPTHLPKHTSRFTKISEKKVCKCKPTFSTLTQVSVLRHHGDVSKSPNKDRQPPSEACEPFNVRKGGQNPHEHVEILFFRFYPNPAYRIKRIL